MACELADASGLHRATKSIAAAMDPTNSINDASLLRGVPLRNLLQNFGALLRTPADGWQYEMSADDAATLYATSREVTLLDWFISHSWRDSSWLKYVAILWTVNWREAMFYANVVAAFWAASTLRGMIPTRHFYIKNLCKDPSVASVEVGTSSVVFMMVFVCVLLKNPRRRRSEDDDPVFFLDKSCIHQTDPVRKALGINSLGGFIRNSKRILVLWSTEYFERLWCNYEIASFASLHGLDRIDFVPLNIAGASVLMYIMWGMLVMTWQAGDSWRVQSHRNGDSDLSPFADVPLLLLVHFLCLCLVSAFCSRSMRTRSKLVKQLESFSLADSKSYCCSVDHTIPSSGRRIPCDRVFVEKNIRSWFAELTEQQDFDGIQSFERCVRELLGRSVKGFLGPYCIPLSSCAPFINFECWHLSDVMVGNFKGDTQMQIKFAAVVFRCWILSFLVIPLTTLIAPSGDRRLRRALSLRRSWPVDIISGFLCACTTFLGFLINASLACNEFGSRSEDVRLSLCCTFGAIGVYSIVHKLAT